MGVILSLTRALSKLPSDRQGLFAGRRKVTFPRLDDPDGFIAQIQTAFIGQYGTGYPAHVQVLTDSARLAINKITTATTTYHDLEHTMMVVSAGLDVMAGRIALDGPISADVWVNVAVALLLHDIGYVGHLFADDHDGQFVADRNGRLAQATRPGTDALLTPFHVDRGQRFARLQFADHAIIDRDFLGACIENTRFPAADPNRAVTLDWPDLVRGADLVGQLGDPRYLAKIPRLFAEFQEVCPGKNAGYKSAQDMIDRYPNFFWNDAFPLLDTTLACLKATPDGQAWIHSLYTQVWEIERSAQVVGA